MVFSLERIRAVNILTWKKLDLKIPKHSVLGVQGGNYTGKSNLVDIILIALYNRTVRSHVKASWVTNGEKSWSITLDFCVGSTSYQVIRGNKLNSFRVGTSSPVLGVSAVNEKMSEILKSPFSQFINVSYLGQNRLTSVASVTDGDRQRLLEPLTNIPDFKLLKNQARFDSGVLEKQLSVYEDRISSLKRRIEKALQAGNQETDDLKLKKEKILNYLSKGQVVFNKTKHSVNNLESLVDELSDTMDTLKLSVQEHTQKIENYKLMASILSDGKGSRCPSCFSYPTPESRKEALKFTNENIKIHEDYKAKSIAERAKQATLQKNLSYELLDTRRMKESLRTQFVTRTSELKAINASLEALKCHKNISSLRSLLRAAEKGMSSCVEDLKYSDFWIGALGGKGIPSYLLAGVVGTLSIRVTDYLNDLLPGVQVKFFHSQEKGTVRCEIVSQSGNIQSFFACSGAEKRLIDVACSFAMRDIAAERYGSVSDFLILDEIFDSLDESHMEGIQRWLEKLKGVTILLISHSETMKNWLPRVETVKFDNKKGSYFI